MPKRSLPPLASEGDRILAARLAADRVCAEMREIELTRALWTERPPRWAHSIDGDGAITSKAQP